MSYVPCTQSDGAAEGFPMRVREPILDMTFRRALLRPVQHQRLAHLLLCDINCMERKTGPFLARK